MPSLATTNNRIARMMPLSKNTAITGAQLRYDRGLRMRCGAATREGWMAAMSWGRSETAHLIQALMAGHMAAGVGEVLDGVVWAMVPRSMSAWRDQGR
jgi:hypothetical protein